MSIILKGIDLPEVNETRMIAITQNGVAFFNTVKNGEASKSEKAEAIQIPKDHGRIGDLDELQKAIRTDMMGGLNYEYFIRNAPTILEAEE